MTAKKDLPDGFETQSYPDDVAGEDREMFVCTVCQKVQWDTFDLEAAKAHASAGQHYPQPAALPGQESQEPIK